MTGTHQLSDEQLDKHAEEYRRILTSLRDTGSVAGLKDCEFQDDIPVSTQKDTT